MPKCYRNVMNSDKKNMNLVLVNILKNIIGFKMHSTTNSSSYRSEIQAKQVNTLFSSRLQLKKKEFVYTPGQDANGLYKIVSGKVKIGIYSERGRETIWSIFGPGEMFGEQSILGIETHSEFAQSLGKTELSYACKTDVLQFTETNHKFGFDLTRLLAKRLHTTDRRFRSLLFKNSRTRILDFLIELAEKKGRAVGDEIFIRHQMTHQEIAQLTDSSRQTVTTLFNDLRTRKLIHFERSRIMIRDMASLRTVSLS